MSNKSDVVSQDTIGCYEALAAIVATPPLLLSIMSMIMSLFISPLFNNAGGSNIHLLWALVSALFLVMSVAIYYKISNMWRVNKDGWLSIEDRSDDT